MGGMAKDLHDGKMEQRTCEEPRTTVEGRNQNDAAADDDDDDDCNGGVMSGFMS